MKAKTASTTCVGSLNFFAKTRPAKTRTFLIHSPGRIAMRRASAVDGGAGGRSSGFRYGAAGRSVTVAIEGRLGTAAESLGLLDVGGGADAAEEREGGVELLFGLGAPTVGREPLSRPEPGVHLVGAGPEPRADGEL